MKAIFAAIRAAMAKLASITVTWIKVGERWIAQIMRGNPPADPVSGAMAELAAVDGAEDLAPLRGLAGHLAQGGDVTADRVKGMPAQQVQWLQAMTRHELCKVLLAKDGDIRGHLRGQRIKGLVPYDATAIAEVAKARANRPKLRPTRRTLRAVLAEAEAIDKGEPARPKLAHAM